jgi:predicted DNA binding CopG/RHH family protein
MTVNLGRKIHDTNKTEAPTRRNRGETDEKLNQIIDALIAWNTSQESSDSQMRISIPTIKGLASAMGANYQKAIQDVLKERGDELEEHHSRLLIGTRHNAGVIKKNEVLQAIACDYLGLENWEEVKYQG